MNIFGFKIIKEDKYNAVIDKAIEIREENSRLDNKLIGQKHFIINIKEKLNCIENKLVEEIQFSEDLLTLLGM